MIDNGHKGTWADALTPDHRSLRVLTDKALHDDGLAAKVMQWHGLATMGAARDMIGAEKLRRTQGTSWDGKR
jgi:hypothetical protein